MSEIDQLDDNIRFPGDVRIEDIVLITHAKESISVIDLFVELNLYEDMYSNTLSGDVTIVDATNLPMNGPLTGLEKILFSFYTPTIDPKKITLLMNVYKVSEPSIENDKKQIYTLFFCSPEQITDSLEKVCKAYSGLQHTFIQDILSLEDTGLKSTRNFDYEDTKLETSCVIPYWNPFKAINWIASRSISANSQLPDMMFYETVDGFNFKSINTLMQQPIAENYMYRVYGQNDLSHPDRASYPNLAADHININNLSIKSRKDIISLIQNGTFAQRLVTYDIITGQLITTTLDYQKEYDKINYHVANGKLLPNTPTLDNVMLNEKSNSYLTIAPNHSNLFANNPDVKRYSEWIMQRQSLLQQYNSTMLMFVVPGDTARRVGDVVELFIPSFEAFTDDQYIPDKYLSGKYIISSIRHHVKKDDHKMIIEVFKDGLNEPMPDEIQKDR